MAQVNMPKWIVTACAEPQLDFSALTCHLYPFKGRILHTERMFMLGVSSLQAWALLPRWRQIIN